MIFCVEMLPEGIKSSKENSSLVFVCEWVKVSLPALGVLGLRAGMIEIGHGTDNCSINLFSDDIPRYYAS
jgi:hypothetical protein